jgi:hypothetical protein
MFGLLRRRCGVKPLEPDLSLLEIGVATEWNEIKEEFPCMFAMFHLCCAC